MPKREIPQSIAQIAELDDLNSLATCTTEFTEARHQTHSQTGISVCVSNYC